MSDVKRRLDWTEADFQFILDDYCKNSTLLNDGSLSIPGFGFHIYRDLIVSAIDFPRDIADVERHKLTMSAVSEARREGKLDGKSVLKIIRKKIHGIRREECQDYLMWTRCAFKMPGMRRRLEFSFDGIKIIISSDIPKEFSWKDAPRKLLFPLTTMDVPGYCFLVAKGCFRNFHIAAENLIESSRILISMINFIFFGRNFFGSEQRPQAVILMGPYQHLYEKGKKIDHIAWYNPSFRLEHWDRLSSDYDKIVKGAATIRKGLAALEAHPLRDVLSDCLALVNEGMESDDMSRRTLRYWTAVERLFSNPSSITKTDIIIKRATYMEEDRRFMRLVLKAASRIRNDYVHWGKKNRDHHQLSQTVADVLKYHFFYLLFHGDDFEDHSAFLEMVDEPDTLEMLEARRLAVERKERMIRTRRHRSVL